MGTIATGARSKPALNLNFLSHGTLESKDLERSRKFYEEFLGCEVVRTSPRSLLMRFGSNHTYAVVEHKKRSEQMPLLGHNGFDVKTQEEVDGAHKIVEDEANKWGLHRITKPVLQHGTYSFYFWDMDDNCWEILTNPKGGYVWLFREGDQKGKGHLDKKFRRPGVKQ